MVATMIGDKDMTQPLAFRQAARHRQHYAVAERHHSRFHVVIVIVALGYRVGARKKTAFEILAHEGEVDNDMGNAEKPAVISRALDLTRIVV